MTTQFRNLVFEGGGMKGLAYIGAMRVLEEKGHLSSIKRVGGTSAGAINALLFALGCSIDEQQNLMETKNFEEFSDDSLFIGTDIYRLITDFGWNKGEHFLEWIDKEIEKKLGKKKATFQDLIDANKPELFVTGTNITTGDVEYFSAEHHANMPICEALRISMAIPVYFTAIRFGPNKDYYVDGGVILNYPVKLFDKKEYIDMDKEADAARRVDYYDIENEDSLEDHHDKDQYVYNRQTLGLRLDSGKEIKKYTRKRKETALEEAKRKEEARSKEEVKRQEKAKRSRFKRLIDRITRKEKKLKEINTFTRYLKSLVSAATSVQEHQHLHSDDWHRTIYIDTLEVKTTDFDMNPEVKKTLVEQGTDGAEKYFSWFENPDADPRPINKI